MDGGVVKFVRGNDYLLACDFRLLDFLLWLYRLFFLHLLYLFLFFYI